MSENWLYVTYAHGAAVKSRKACSSIPSAVRAGLRAGFGNRSIQATRPHNDPSRIRTEPSAVTRQIAEEDPRAGRRMTESGLYAI